MSAVGVAPQPGIAARADALAPSDAGAFDVLLRHGDHSSAFLAFNDGIEYFTDPAIDGMIAYATKGGRHLTQLCGPFAAPDDKLPLLRSFRSFARERRQRVMAVQLRPDDARLYAEAGFRVNQLGSSYSIDLDDFSLRGTRFMKTRNKISRARRLGLTVDELDPDDRARPATADALNAIDAAWLRGKGALAQQLAFLVGERDGRGSRLRRVFVARRDGEAIAYVTYSPCFGERPGWLYDLTRRRPDAPPGTIELVFHTALEQLKGEGCRWLHLGLTPFRGLADEHELASGTSSVVRRIVRLIAEHGELVYPARTQEEFKLKWAPHLIEPEYIAFDGRVSLGAVVHLMRLTRSIPL